MQLNPGCLREGKVGLLSDRELITLMLRIIRPAKRIRDGVISSPPLVALLGVIQKMNFLFWQVRIPFSRDAEGNGAWPRRSSDP